MKENKRKRKKKEERNDGINNMTVVKLQGQGSCHLHVGCPAGFNLVEIGCPVMITTIIKNIRVKLQPHNVTCVPHPSPVDPDPAQVLGGVE